MIVESGGCYVIVMRGDLSIRGGAAVGRGVFGGGRGETSRGGWRGWGGVEAGASATIGRRLVSFQSGREMRRILVLGDQKIRGGFQRCWRCHRGYEGGEVVSSVPLRPLGEEGGGGVEGPSASAVCANRHRPCGLAHHPALSPKGRGERRKKRTECLEISAPARDSSNDHLTGICRGLWAIGSSLSELRGRKEEKRPLGAMGG